MKVAIAIVASVILFGVILANAVSQDICKLVNQTKVVTNHPTQKREI